MTTTFTLDQKILQKNLEITKLTQEIDRLKTELVDKSETITQLQQHILLINETNEK